MKRIDLFLNMDEYIYILDFIMGILIKYTMPTIYRKKLKIYRV